MHQRFTRLALTAVAFLVLVAASRPAFADVTITGTVGEIGVLPPIAWVFGGGAYSVFRFKFTDANQTATCLDQSQQKVGTTTKYAYFRGTDIVSNIADIPYREWYAALLVSKKGAVLTCTIKDNQDCHVTSCTLP